MMNIRYKFSIVLVCLGIVSAIMSFGGKKSAALSPEEILAVMMKGENLVSPDQLAEMVVEEDSCVQIVDVRDPLKYKSQSIPGAINIPLAEIFLEDNASVLRSETIKTLLYSDDESISSETWILGMQKGYSNLYILKGGLTEWNRIVMESSFAGEKISAQENALFEKRFKARRLFTSWNAMPDSLKAGFFVAKKTRDRELVGGCE
jgi:rhodanese-related sulfurtransferase